MTTAKTDPQYPAAVSALEQANTAATSLSAAIGTAAGTRVEREGSRRRDRLPGARPRCRAQHAPRRCVTAAVGSQPACATATPSWPRASGALRRRRPAHQRPGPAHRRCRGAPNRPRAAHQRRRPTRLGAHRWRRPRRTAHHGPGDHAGRRGQGPWTDSLDQRPSRHWRRESPGIFSSGYFVLSAIAGAQPAQRNAATFTINLLRGGTAGQIIVVSKYPASDPRSDALGTPPRHAWEAPSPGARTCSSPSAGRPASLGDLTSVTQVARPARHRRPGARDGARARPGHPRRAAAGRRDPFALLVAAATFGVLQLLFGGATHRSAAPATWTRCPSSESSPSPSASR